MSEQGSGRYDVEHYDESHEGVPREGGSASFTPPVNFELEVDIDMGSRGGGGGSGGGGKPSKKPGMTLEERARVLSQPEPPGPMQQSTVTDRPPLTVAYPYAAAQVQVATAPPPTADPGFRVENAYMPPQTTPPVLNPSSDPWIAAGSLKPLEQEEVLLRRAGSLSDVLNVYLLVSYVMLTNRRVVIKQSSRIFGINLFTVESSFLYPNLRHITVQRVTNFRFLWTGIAAILVGIVFLGLAAAFWVYAFVGIALLFGGVFFIYWFFIFYNSNSVVIDFSKGELVGSWLSVKGKGAFITKSLILHIDHCFEVMYAIYNNARTAFAADNEA